MSGFRVTIKPDILEDGEYWCSDDEGNSLLVHDVHSSSSAADLARKQWEESPEDDFPISVEDSRGHIWIYTRNTVKHKQGEPVKPISQDKLLQAFYSAGLIAYQAYCQGYQVGFQNGIDLADDTDLDRLWMESKAHKSLTAVLEELDKEESDNQPALVIKEIR